MKSATINAIAEIRGANCSGTADGQLSVAFDGGTPPYDWFWLDTPNPALDRNNLSPGNYTIIVTDNNGCETEATFTVDAPLPLEPISVDCESITEGVLFNAPSGGTPPYAYATDGHSFGGQEVLHQLMPGEVYTITIRDAAGCEIAQDIHWPVIYDRIADLPSSMEIELGQPDTIRPVLHIPPDLISSVQWTPSTGLSCFDCLYPEIQITGPETYTLRIVDYYGCNIELRIDITIDESSDIFIPTAFSPNGDQVNDYLSIYANTYQVSSVLAFRVFDRWGGLMFEAEHFPPNRERLGWDGNFRGRPMDPGVYTYVVIVELATGSRKTIGGHTLLAR